MSSEWRSEWEVTKERFPFGKNWQGFVNRLTPERIEEAERGLTTMLECESLSGKRFLDIGSGSGIFSLAARRLGARVHSFDSDPESVACTNSLKNRFYTEDGEWSVDQGSVLDAPYMRSLGSFDVVYVWGVLHHTGDLWQGIENAHIPVRDGGRIFVAIYNDQGPLSEFWKRVKRAFCSGPLGKAVVIGILIPYFAAMGVISGFVKYGNPLRHFSEYRSKRGMSVYHDWIDWLGGYPFEVARAEEVFEYYRSAGFELRKLVTTNGLGCNQFVFEKVRSN